MQPKHRENKKFQFCFKNIDQQHQAQPSSIAAAVIQRQAFPPQTQFLSTDQSVTYLEQPGDAAPMYLPSQNLQQLIETKSDQNQNVIFNQLLDSLEYAQIKEEKEQINENDSDNLELSAELR